MGWWCERGSLLHGEGPSGQFARVRVQEGEFQAAQRGQPHFVFDAHYLHQLLFLKSTRKNRLN